MPRKLKVTDDLPEDQFHPPLSNGVSFTQVRMFKAGRKRVGKFFVKKGDLKMEMSFGGGSYPDVIKKIQDFLQTTLKKTEITYHE